MSVPSPVILFCSDFVAFQSVTLKISTNIQDFIGLTYSGQIPYVIHVSCTQHILLYMINRIKLIKP
jgi:hypothetical protein